MSKNLFVGESNPTLVKEAMDLVKSLAGIEKLSPSDRDALYEMQTKLYKQNGKTWDAAMEYMKAHFSEMLGCSPTVTLQPDADVWKAIVAVNDRLAGKR